MNINIVGMDPSLSNYGVVNAELDLDRLTFRITDMKVVQTEPEQDKTIKKMTRKNALDLERAQTLHAGAMESIEYARVAFIEVPVGSQDAASMKSYGVCLGVIAAVANTIPIVQVSPSEVKLVATGNKEATKGEMIAAMMKKYPDAPWPLRKYKGEMVPNASLCEHMADACAAIEAGLLTDDFKRIAAVLKSMSKMKLVA